MKISEWLGVSIIAFISTQAAGELGDSYEESVKKHGEPIGRMLSKDHTVYLFQAEGYMAREVYDEQNTCIKSDFHTPAAPEAPVPEAEPEPVPELVPQPIPEPEAASPRKSASLLWLTALLPLIVLIGGATFYLIRRTRRRSADRTRNEEQLPDAHQDATLRLSRNEMSFLKTLHEAVADQYMVTFHIALDRIIDFDAPNIAPYVPELKTLTPLYADFVLHNTEDSAVSCVILLKDSKTQSEKKNRRIQFQQMVLEEHGIQVLVVHQNFEYDVRKIQDQLAFLRKAARRSVA